MFADATEPGQRLPGTVTKLVPFGAFVQVARGIEGLVHVSEIAWTPVEDPSDVVQLGDEITGRRHGSGQEPPETFPLPASGPTRSERHVGGGGFFLAGRGIPSRPNAPTGWPTGREWRAPDCCPRTTVRP
ncbi:S1 RNA-binding domain-containing protein [Streptomyces katrae]|uniref:S1 RNA-binding domain-containing protein n=1 Tax=Streptomyces katrae TaxID=68223 RepID=UPI001FE092D3|nr:S1 RNA-binding domain-containing protein [Streptomyces katrae]